MIVKENGINKATGDSFRFVYNDAKTFAIIIKGGEDTVTSTIHNIEEFEIRQDALNRIIELKIPYEDSEG